MATKNLVPRADHEGTLGTAAKKWSNIYADAITLVDGETLATKLTAISGTADSASATATEAIATAEGLESTVSTHTAQLAGTADSALKEQILQKADKATTLAGYGITDAAPLDSPAFTTSATLDGNAIDSIVEQDDNTTNHHYIRYASGLQICWGSADVTLTITTPWGSMYESTTSPAYMNFGKAFNSNPMVSISVCRGNGLFAFVEGIDVNATGCRPAYLVRANSTGAKNYNLAYIAIGRWE